MKMLAPAFVTEVPGLHVTVVKGIHEMSFDRGVVRIWTYDQYGVGESVERRVNADLLMSFEDLLTMLDQVTSFVSQQGSQQLQQLIAVRLKGSH